MEKNPEQKQIFPKLPNSMNKMFTINFVPSKEDVPYLSQYLYNRIFDLRTLIINLRTEYRKQKQAQSQKGKNVPGKQKKQFIPTEEFLFVRLVLPQIQNWKGLEGHFELIEDKLYDFLLSKKKKFSDKPVQITGKTYSIASGDGVIFRISLLSLYPYDNGYANVSDKKQDCFKLWWSAGNKDNSFQPYTVIGVNYNNKNPLSDFIGIMVAEQVRFNTLRILNEKIGTRKKDDASDIFWALYSRFQKTIYLNWNDDKLWEKKNEYQGVTRLVRKYTNFLLAEEENEEKLLVFKKLDFEEEQDQEEDSGNPVESKGKQGENK